MQTLYYLVIDKQRTGPFAKDQLLAAGLKLDTLVWFDGCPDWLPASQVPELAALFSETADGDHRLYAEAYLRGSYNIGTVLFRCAWFLGLCSIVFFIIGTLGNEAVVAGRQDSMAQVFSSGAGALTLLCALGGAIAFLVLLYRCWAVIQDDNVHRSAGAAIGFLFVPVFNIYWIFVATAGLTRELHRYACRHRLKAPRPSLLLAITISCYALLSTIPIVGSIAWVFNLILIPLFMQSIYQTARCFCVENRTIEDDEAVLRRPVVGRYAFGSGMFAIIMAPLAISLCLSGSLLTPVPYVVLLRWQADKVKAAPIPDGRLRFDRERSERDRQIKEAKRALLGGNFEPRHFMLILVISFIGGVMLFAAMAFARAAGSANADQPAVPPEGGRGPPTSDPDRRADDY